MKPTIREENGGERRDDRYTLDHPAFGIMEVSRVSGGDQRLYGSDLRHNNVIRVAIHTSCESRSLSRCVRHEEKRLAEWYMSEAQWAHFVSSIGGAHGTPITFRLRPGDDAEVSAVPRIDVDHTEREIHARELIQASRDALANVNEVLKQVTELHANGKANKTQLAEVIESLKSLKSLPNHLDFITESFDKAMDKTVAAGKVEMEAYVSNLISQTGLEVLRKQSGMLLGGHGQPAPTEKLISDQDECRDDQ